MLNPAIYNTADVDKIQGLYPIYSLTAGITQNYLFKLISGIIDKNIMLNEIFSTEFRKKYELAEINYSIRNIHFPKNYDMVKLSRDRIIFQELFLFQLALLI